MLLDQVLLQVGVAVKAGLEHDLPLLARSELAVVPERGGDRSVYLGARRQPGLDR